MRLTREQRRVAATALRVANRLGASPKVRKALIAAGLVESNLRNVNYGDRDSLGFLQQRPSQGWGSPAQVRNVEHATRQFVTRAMRLRNRHGSAADLAQAVQRSAFPQRYHQRAADAEAVIRSLVSNVAGTSSAGGATTRTVTKTVPGVDRSEDRKALLLDYLDNERGKPDALLNLAAGLKEAQDTPARTVTRTVRIPSSRRRRSRGPRPSRPGSGQTNIVALGRLARSMGLRVAEHPRFDRVDPVHTAGSHHYQNRSGTGGDAIDVSGPPHLMARFARIAARRYGRDLEELIWRGAHARTIKNGRRVSPSFYSGHTDHVHAADTD